MKTAKVYIGNLPADVDKDELEEEFQKFGKIVEFDILKDYGFVHYKEDSEAKAAVEALNGTLHNGNKIKVEVSRSTVRNRPGMGGKGECFRCGGDGHWAKECPSGGPSRGRGRDRFDPYDRQPYYPSPYDYYARSRLAAAAYDRYRYDPYERRLPPSLPAARDLLYRDYDRLSSAELYRRPSPPRDPYYDYYERRRLALLDAYGDKASSSLTGGDTLKLMTIARVSSLQGRVPGPY